MSRNATGPKRLWVKAGDELVERPRLGLGGKRCGRGAARAGLALRDGEDRAGIKHVALRGDREHVVDAVSVQAGTELGVVAVCLVAQHRRATDLPARRPGDQLTTERRLGLKLDARG